MCREGKRKNVPRRKTQKVEGKNQARCLRSDTGKGSGCLKEKDIRGRTSDRLKNLQRKMMSRLIML